MIKKVLNFLVGLCILFVIYFVCNYIIKILQIQFSSAILGLILFTCLLQFKIIKEDWIKSTVEFFLKNMAILFAPFIVGLVTYKELLLENWLAILLVIFLATTLTIVFVGLFVEYGLKFLRLYKMKRKNNE